MQEYRDLRDVTMNHTRPLLECSPITLFFGGWDASHRSRQGHYHNILVGEIIKILANQDGDPGIDQSKREGTQIDPSGARIRLDWTGRKAITDVQKGKLPKQTCDNSVSKDKKEGLAQLDIEATPSSLEQLGGVIRQAIIRLHVLGFATLRVLCFDSLTPEGDAACRAPLAALAFNGLVRSDVEFLLRINCDLVGTGPAVITLDKRYGQKENFEPLSIDQARDLFSAAIDYAVQVISLNWDSFVLNVKGSPMILAAATNDMQSD